jgi:hypothetical protein
VRNRGSRALFRSRPFHSLQTISPWPGQRLTTYSIYGYGGMYTRTHSQRITVLSSPLAVAVVIFLPKAAPIVADNQTDTKCSAKILSLVFAYLHHSFVSQQSVEYRAPMAAANVKEVWKPVRKSVLYLIAAVALAISASTVGGNSLPAGSRTQVEAVDDVGISAQDNSHSRRLLGYQRVTVYTTAPEADQDNPIARKQLADLIASLPTDVTTLDVVALNLMEQRHFLEQNCYGKEEDNMPVKMSALKRFDELRTRGQDHLATEVYKWCALKTKPYLSDSVAYIDSSSPLLMRLQDFLSDVQNVVVLGDDYFPHTAHGSLIVLRDNQLYVAEQMMKVLLETPAEHLEVNPLLLPQRLYEAVAFASAKKHPKPGKVGDFLLLKETCRMDPLRRHNDDAKGWTDTQTRRHVHHCPERAGFCCSIHDISRNRVVLMSRHPLLPFQILSQSFSRPYNAEADHYEEDELPYITTIQATFHERPADMPETPNFYALLAAKDCLPDKEECSKCCRNQAGATRELCAKDCPCYAKALCSDKPPPKHVAHTWTVTPPAYTRDPNRVVPRIVHQTWFEDLAQDRYPNMSRMVQSFRNSGWEYKFYNDDDAVNFLSTHFPPEVREAYEALRPGAFKADLFRYCVLLIHGGLYADVDIMLESALDAAIGPDVGFMVPTDEPGMATNHRMCLWNGMIAAAPGHPYLAKAIETVVNQVRNRFTSVDIDATLCPNPELSISHAYDTLFTAGPCLLGASINRVLGRHPQKSFTAGEINILADRRQLEAGTSFIVGDGVALEARVPGRSVILKQDKWDMGAHRFTYVERNLVVSATDLQDSNDRDTHKKNKKTEHYSTTHAKTGIYGLEGLYTDTRIANEDIRIILDVSKQASVPSSTS